MTWKAAHVQPYAGSSPSTGCLLLCSDLHRLYDQGDIAVDPDDRCLLVSGRIREEFQNGRHDYALEGQRIADHRTFTPVTRERLLYHARTCLPCLRVTSTSRPRPVAVCHNKLCDRRIACVLSGKRPC